jgi:hypothetical protein
MNLSYSCINPIVHGLSVITLSCDHINKLISIALSFDHIIKLITITITCKQNKFILQLHQSTCLRLHVKELSRKFPLRHPKVLQTRPKSAKRESPKQSRILGRLDSPNSETGSRLGLCREPRLPDPHQIVRLLSNDFQLTLLNLKNFQISIFKFFSCFL